MAKFNAGQAVERLEYDFTDYGGKEGVINEPSTGRVNGFFRSMKSLVRDVKGLQHMVGDLQGDDLTDEQMIEAMDKVEELEGVTSEYQRKSMESLAELCGADWVGEGDERHLVGGSPTLEELQDLPYRVLTAFSSWLVQEIQPKRTTPATRR